MDGIDTGSIAGHVVAIVLTIVSPILAFCVTQVLRALARRFNVDASLVQDQQVQWAVDKGVHFAEEWAASHSEKPTGSAKADQAFAVVNQLLDNPTVQEYGVDALRNLIKSKVGELNADETKVK